MLLRAFQDTLMNRDNPNLEDLGITTSITYISKYISVLKVTFMSNSERKTVFIWYLSGYSV